MTSPYDWPNRDLSYWRPSVPYACNFRFRLVKMIESAKNKSDLEPTMISVDVFLKYLFNIFIYSMI